MNPSHNLQQPTSRFPGHMRWTLLDIGIVVVAAFLLTTLAVVVFQLTNTVASGALGDMLRGRALLASMLAGGMVYGLLLLMTYLWIVRRRGVSWRELGLSTPPLLPMLLTLPIFVGQLLLVAVINAVVIQLVGQFSNPQIAALTDPTGFSWLNFAAVFFVAALLAPFVEEVLFRGLLYQWLRVRTGVIVAVLVSAAIFSVTHVIPLLLPALFAVGIVLALVYEWTGSLWVTITLHFLQNAFAVIIIFSLQALEQLP
jgi:membrane protease YdiL (CAAX protease family)